MEKELEALPVSVLLMVVGVDVRKLGVTRELKAGQCTVRLMAVAAGANI